MLLNRPRLKLLALRLLDVAQIDEWLLSRMRRHRLVAVLNLHRVSPAANPFWPPMHPEIFEELLRFLSGRFEVTTFANLDSPASPRPRVILSFDDGYQDFLEYAAPLLRKYRLPANQNVIPACVESGLAPWNIQLYDFLNDASRRVIDRIKVPGFDRHLNGDDDDSKARYGRALSRFLKMRPRRERTRLWSAISAVMAEEYSCRRTRMLDVADVRQAAGDFEVGVHSYSHESMGFESNEFFVEDLAHCQQFFRDIMRLPLEIYAFPNGSYRKEQIEIASAMGFRHILLVDERLAPAPPGVSVFPRLSINGATALEVRFQTLSYRQLRPI